MKAKALVIFIILAFLVFMPGPRSDNNYWILVLIPFVFGSALATYSIHNLLVLGHR